MSNKNNARFLAVKALCRVDADGSYSNITLNSLLSDYDLSAEDKALCSRIFYGTLDRKITIDFILKSFINKGFNKLKPFTLNTLRSAVYQIKYLDKIPDSAAVNEAVKLMKASKESFAANFVNGVLRNVAKTDIKLPDGNDSASISVRFSCPEAIVKGLIRDYGVEDTVKFLDNSLLPPPTYIRVNTLKTTADELTSELQNIGVSVEKTELQNCLSISGYSALEQMEVFKKGFFHVQDIACQTAVNMLDIQNDDSVLDLCSAPGGKAFTAYLLAERVRITATDLYPKRVKLINSGASRLGFERINAVTLDATKFDSELGQFDRIICDVPCSGIGVLRRKPEIKYKEPDDIAELVNIQYDILMTADRYLKSGGKLLYSTCTLNKAENENNVLRFLSEHKNYTLCSIKTFMPQNDGSDGFFAAVIVKN